MVANFCLEYFSHQLCNRMNENSLGPFRRGQHTKCSWGQNSGRPRGGHHQLTRSLSASAVQCKRGWSLIQQELQPQVSTVTVNTTSANQRTSSVSTSQPGIPLHLTQVHSRSRPQMTVGNFQANTRPFLQQRSMDSYFPLDDLNCFNSAGSDHSLQTSEIGSFDTSIYASSPNSLYMYDQEKADMQSSYNNTCNPTSLFFSDDFDLKSQYEASREICPPVSSPSCTAGQPTATVSENTSWDGNKNMELDIKTEDIYQMDTGSVVSGPTLAELNSTLNSESLIEDIITTDVLRQNLSDKPISSFKTDVKTSVTTSHAASSPAIWSFLQTKGGNLKTATASSRSATNLSDWTALTQTVLSTDQLVSQTPVLSRAGTFSTSTSVSKVPQSSAKSSPALHDLLKQNVSKPAATVSPQPALQTVPGRTSPGKRRNPSAPAAVGRFDVRAVDQKWEEIKQFLNDDPKESATSPPQPKIKRESRTSVSSAVGSITSVDDDDDHDSDIDSDIDGHHWMSDSDEESEESQEAWKTGNTKDSKPKKERQYFWQYNIQSKGPKGTRVDFGMDTSDPHVLHDFEDPVFDPHTCTIVGMGTAIRHGGKARKGDGNDVSPNPRKLCQIGQQLKRLSKQINSFAPLNELPVSTRNKSKKEKNKLASRACRLKKKAQHEANKLKLYGLELEHKQLMKVLQRIREELKIQINKDKDAEDKISTSELLEDLIKENLTDMVAGNAAEYVNKITKRVDEGDPTGGLDQT